MKKWEYIATNKQYLKVLDIQDAYDVKCEATNKKELHNFIGQYLDVASKQIENTIQDDFDYNRWWSK